MIYLLDTNALSDLVREQPKIVARLANLTSLDQTVTCTIALGGVLVTRDAHFQRVPGLTVEDWTR